MAAGFPQPSEPVEKAVSRLYERMMTDCVMRVRSSAPDGEGGKKTSWEDGEPFRAVVVKTSGIPTRVAEHTDESVAYTVTAERELQFHEAFRRVSDNAAFRVTSGTEDSAPPQGAEFGFQQATAERWEETS